MATKEFDAVVATRKYTDRNGQEKTVWENVGTVMRTDKGLFLSLKRTFNPAGVPNPDNRDTVAISLFVPKESNDSGNTEHGKAKANAYAPTPSEDDIPF